MPQIKNKKFDLTRIGKIPSQVKNTKDFLIFKKTLDITFNFKLKVYFYIRGDFLWLIMN